MQHIIKDISSGWLPPQYVVLTGGGDGVAEVIWIIHSDDDEEDEEPPGAGEGRDRGGYGDVNHAPIPPPHSDLLDDQPDLRPLLGGGGEIIVMEEVVGDVGGSSGRREEPWGGVIDLRPASPPHAPTNQEPLTGQRLEREVVRKMSSTEAFSDPDSRRRGGRPLGNTRGKRPWLEDSDSEQWAGDRRRSPSPRPGTSGQRSSRTRNRVEDQTESTFLKRQRYWKWDSDSDSDSDSD